MMKSKGLSNWSRLPISPLLYVIPYSNVAADVREAIVDERAHLLSLEFIIEPLDRAYLDSIEVM